MSARFEPRPGAPLGDWVLQRPGGSGEWEGSWLVQDGAGALGVAYLLPAGRGLDIGRLAALKHPALVELVGMGERPVPYLVRERIAAKPLAAYMMSGAAPEGLAISIVAQVASGLAALHAEGLCHGMLSDSRVLVESIREPRVLLVGQGLAGQRWQGGLDHAAPECVRGSLTEPAADVYTLGLVLWQLLHGRLPWAEHGRSQALLRRGREQPRARAGSGPVRALVEACLAIDPVHRPTALEVVRGLEELGARLSAPDGLHLRRRARSITVLEGRVRKQLDRWLDNGGRLGILGPSGSGRTRLLDAMSTALRVRGLPFVRITPGGHAWDAIEHALCSPGLPGPPVMFPSWAPEDSRAQVGALALAQRAPGGFHLLVDDYELLDEPSRACLAVLAGDPRAAICVSAREAPTWVEWSCALEPWKREQVLQLLRGVLGEVQGQEDLAGQLWTVAGGVPGPTIQRLLALVNARALRWDVLRWAVVPDRLPRALQDTTVPDDPLAGLGPVARRLGSTLALAGAPCTIEYLCHLAAVDEDEGRMCVRELIHAGLARVEHRQMLPRNAEALADLRRACEAPRSVYRRLAAQQLELPEIASARLGWLLLGAEDAGLVEVHGAGSIEAVSLRDAAEGVQLARGLWRIMPHASLVAPFIRALGRAGDTREAVEFGDRWIGAEPLAPEAPLVAATVAWVLARAGARDEATAWVGRCRSLEGVEPELLCEVEARLAFANGELPSAAMAARRLADREAPEDDPERLDRWLVLRALWARALQRGGSPDLAIGVLEPVPAELGRCRPHRAALDGLLGAMLLDAGRYREAAGAIELALGREQGLPPVARARLLHDLGRAQRVLGNREEALRSWRESLAVLERAGEQRLGLRALDELARCLRELCRVEEAEAAGRLGFGRASELGEHLQAAQAALGLVELFVQRRDLDEASRWWVRAEGELDTSPSERLEAVLACWRGELALRRHDAHTVELLEDARQLAGATLGPAASAVVAAQLVLARTRAGGLEHSASIVEDTLGPLRKVGAGLELATARLWIAEALHLLGRAEEAEREASKASIFAEEVGHLRLEEQATQVLARVGSRAAQEPRAEQLGQLLELAMAVVRERDTDALLGRIASSALELLHAERAFVLIGSVGTMEVAAAVCRDGLIPGRPSTSVVNRALQEGKEVIVADISERSDLRGSISVLTMDLGSAMCVPMIHDELTLGAIYVDSQRSATVEPARAVQLLRTLAGYGAVAVSHVEQLQRVARQAEDAAEIAHDLRSPAASITILAEELRRTLPAGHSGHERVQRIMDASQHIQDMTGTMLRAEELLLQPVDLSQLVRRAVALEEPAAQRQGVSLSLDLEPELEVQGDALALSRVVSNLVANAVRHSPRGGSVSVHVAVDDDEIICRVRDHGPGIPRGAERSIFERGVQVGDGVGRRGLGLAIARRIVEQHGGRIGARNLGGQGAEVVFTVPLTPS